MKEQAAALRYAVRFRVLGKYGGQLGLVLAALTLVPLTVSLLFGDLAISLRYGIIVAVLGTTGALLARLNAPTRVQANEGMVLVALVFLIAPLVMSWPMMASGMEFMDALFEAISAATTTGLTTRASVENAPETFLFARAWMQWYGGLGIMAVMLALIVRPGGTSKGLAVTEAEADDLVGGTKAHSRRLLLVYGILTALGIGLLLALGVNSLQAVAYAMAAVSTGGFAPRDNSLAGLGGAAAITVIALCLLGAVPFVLYRQVFSKRFRFNVNLLQLAALLVCGLLFALPLAFHLGLAHGDWGNAWYHALLMAFSAQTTAGFSTLDLSSQSDFAKAILIPAMAIGGGVGSTAGGFKTLRLIILLRLIEVVVRRVGLAPHAVIQPRLEDRPLDDQELKSALLLIALFVGVVVLSWIPFVAMGYNPLDSLFEVVSATGTVGLSAGITHSELPTLLKLILCADMLMGRLEIIAWLVFLNPFTWFGKRWRTT